MDRRSLDGLFGGAAGHHPAILGMFPGACGEMLSGSDVRNRIESLGAALAEFGLAARSRLAVIAPVGGNAVTGALAAFVAGGVPVLIDRSLDDACWRRAMLESEATHAVVSDADHLRRLVALRPDLPALELVLVFAPATDDRPSPAMTVDEAVARGSRLLEEPEGRSRGTVVGEAAAADDVVLGTATADGVVSWTSRSALFRESTAISAELQLRGDDLVLARPARLSASLLAIAIACWERAVPMIADDGSESLAAVLTRVRPTVGIVTMGDLEATRLAIANEIASRPLIFRKTHAWALGCGRNRADGGMMLRLAEALSLKGLRGRLGGRIRLLTIQGAGPELLSDDFFPSLGVAIQPLPEL